MFTELTYLEPILQKHAKEIYIYSETKVQPKYKLESSKQITLS